MPCLYRMLSESRTHIASDNNAKCSIVCSKEAAQYHVHPKVTASRGTIKAILRHMAETYRVFELITELLWPIHGDTGHNPCVKLLVSASPGSGKQVRIFNCFSPLRYRAQGAPTKQPLVVGAGR